MYRFLQDLGDQIYAEKHQYVKQSPKLWITNSQNGN